MTQISRPFQIALVAMGLFVAVWFVVLRGHSSSTGSSSSSAPASSSSSQAPSSSSPAGPSSAYHGSAPGVAGLTRAIDKARGAVAQSQQNAHELQQKSAQASSSAPARAAGAGAATGSGATVVKVHKTTTTKQPGAKAAGVAGAAGAADAGSASAKGADAPKMQARVEAELKQGKVVTILFWNPKASVDVKVRNELNALGHEQGGKIAVHDALANQVGSFGSFTRTVQVYGTPTILIVNKQGQTTSLTGLTDVFSLKQAIAEAKSAH